MLNIRMFLSRKWYIVLSVLLVLIAGCRLVEHRSSQAVNPQAASPISPPKRPVLDRPDPDRMQAHIERLAGEIGVRRAGSAQERAGADYIAGQLAGWGYRVRRTPVTLPGKQHADNVLAELSGASDRVLLISAHMDSKPPAPGANDDASGVAVMLEIARILKKTTPPCTVLFVAFTGEERLGGRQHHFGSRTLAADAALRARLAAMTSLDMVGVGSTLYIDDMGGGSHRWRDFIAAWARRRKLPIRVGRSRAMSDHASFAAYNLPVAYLHWERDSAYHKRTDTPDHIRPERMRAVAAVMIDAILHADQVFGKPG